MLQYNELNYKYHSKISYFSSNLPCLTRTFNFCLSGVNKNLNKGKFKPFFKNENGVKCFKSGWKITRELNVFLGNYILVVKVKNHLICKKLLYNFFCGISEVFKGYIWCCLTGIRYSQQGRQFYYALTPNDRWNSRIGIMIFSI